MQALVVRNRWLRVLMLQDAVPLSTIS